MNLDSIIELDHQATLWLNNLATPATDPFWLMLSDNKFWFPAYGIVMGFMIWKLGWKKGLAVILSLILCVVVIDQSSNVVKAGFERLRPCYNSWMLENGIRLPYGVTGHLFGFFSAHASNTFGFASCSYLGFMLNDSEHSYKAYGWGVFIWAVLVSASRVVLGAHFLGDVLVGSLYGLAIGTAIAFLTHYLIKVALKGQK